jgi:hypothetical protein
MIQTPFEVVNQPLEKGARNFLERLGLDVNVPSITWPFAEGYRLYNYTHGDVVGAFTISILTLVVLIGVAVNRKETKNIIKNREFRIISLVTLAQFITFSLFIRWQPWGNRLLLTCIILLSLTLALIIVKLFNQKLVVATLCFMFGINVFWMLHNPSRSLLDSAYLCRIDSQFCVTNSHKRPRSEEYFLNNYKIYSDYMSVTNFINTNDIKTVYLKTGEDEYEYPLWVLTKYGTVYKHFVTEEEFEKIQGIVACTVECFKNQKIEHIYDGQYIKLYRKS